MKNLAIRAASGLVFVTLMIGGILYSKWTFLLVMLVVLIGSLNEFFNITATKREPQAFKLTRKWPLIILFALVYLLSFGLAQKPGALPDPSGGQLMALIKIIGIQSEPNLVFYAVIPLLICLLFIFELFTQNANPFANIGWNVVAVCYLLIPMCLTNRLYFDQKWELNGGGVLVVAIFAIIWLYDSASYVFGSVIGRTPLFKRISPKKTVEGSLGGMVTVLVTTWFLAAVPQLRIDVYGRVQWVILAFVIIIIATFGDLVESMLKRSLAIKDSGAIMPGHGGFLDRFDAYYLTVPFILLTFWVFNTVGGIITLIQATH